MRKTGVWQRLLGVEKATVERVGFDDADAEDGDLRVVAHVRVHKGEQHRCGLRADRQFVVSAGRDSGRDSPLAVRSG